jgi:hypothetical protein
VIQRFAPCFERSDTIPDEKAVRPHHHGEVIDAPAGELKAMLRDEKSAPGGCL